MLAIRVQLPRLRMERRLSQRQLAAMAGVRPDTISAIERGEAHGIRFETLASLCEVLGCQPGDILDVQATVEPVPTLGGPDEDEIIYARMSQAERWIDGPSFVQELVRLAAETTEAR